MLEAWTGSIRFARSPGRGGIASLVMAALSMVAAAPSTSGRNAERPAACLINRHGRLGWLLDEVKGPRNSEVEPEQFAVIGDAFADVGVPSSQVVCAIENIIYADSCAQWTMIDDRGVSGSLRFKKMAPDLLKSFFNSQNVSLHQFWADAPG
jgi:hypothetical protein